MKGINHIDCLIGIEELKQKNLIPQLIICDPPYEFQSSGKGIVGMRETFNRIKDAELNSFDFDKFIPKILDLQGDKVNAYFFCNKKLLPKYLNLAIERKLNYDILTMNKKAPIPCKNSSYLPEIEYIVFLRSKGSYWNGKLDYKLYFKSFFCYTNGVNNIHPTQKPINIIKKFIRVSSQPNDLVLDCFAGSGTTLVAAKEVNRKYVGFEINKEFVELTKQRLKNTYEDKGLKQYITNKEVLE